MFLCFCFVKKAQKAIFLQFCRFLSILLLSLNSFFSSCFFFVLSSLSNFHFSLLFVHQPLLGERSYVWFLLFFFFLPFPFLMFACFFETNFPSTPFCNPSCFHFCFFFFLFFLFVFSWCMFLPFCFCVSFVFGNDLVLFMFLSCFLFCFQSMKKHCFPCNSGVFLS